MNEDNSQTNFNQFVLSTCVPAHVRAARQGMTDWTPFNSTTYVSPSSGLVHQCHPQTCTSWVIRFVDGVRVCAITGQLLMQETNSPSPKKRGPPEENGGKRHQDKAIPGSSAYLEEKFNLSESMQIEPAYSSAFPRLNQYPYN